MIDRIDVSKWRIKNERNDTHDKKACLRALAMILYNDGMILYMLYLILLVISSISTCKATYCDLGNALFCTSKGKLAHICQDTFLSS